MKRPSALDLAHLLAAQKVCPRTFDVLQLEGVNTTQVFFQHHGLRCVLNFDSDTGAFQNDEYSQRAATEALPEVLKQQLRRQHVVLLTLVALDGTVEMEARINGVHLNDPSGRSVVLAKHTGAESHAVLLSVFLSVQEALRGRLVRA